MGALEADTGRVEERATEELTRAELRSVRALLDLAFGARFSEDDWEHALGGTHLLVRDDRGRVIAHAAVVPRRIEVDGRPYRAGYVEAVATHPEWRGRGLARRVMAVAGELIRDRYEIGALSGDPALYRRMGWTPWRGATWCRTAAGRVRTAEEDAGVLVLLPPSGPELDTVGDISVEWRPGDVW